MLIALLTFLGIVCCFAALVSSMAAIDDYLKAWQAGLGFCLFIAFLLAAIGLWAYAGALHRG